MEWSACWVHPALWATETATHLWTQGGLEGGQRAASEAAGAGWTFGVISLGASTAGALINGPTPGAQGQLT